VRGGRPILRKQRGESKRICDIQFDFFNVTVAKNHSLIYNSSYVLPIIQSLRLRL
jgi:hypothetical protein